MKGGTLGMIVKNIKDIMTGEILGEDVIHGDIFLIKKGTELSKRMIDLLKKRQIEKIKISLNDSEAFQEQNHGLNSELPPAINKYNENTIKDTFFQSLAHVGYEHRFGKILNKNEDVQFLIQLFTDMHMNYDFMDTLYMLKSWDHYTFKHSFDVFVLGTLLAKRQGIHSLDSVALGYLFHDIGKIKISQDILSKKGKLTFNEFERIKKHTIKGEIILNALGQNHIAHFARSHHERIDGTGYPDHLSEKALSKEIKILNIVDVYSALTLKRPYKDAIPAQEALQILTQNINKYDKEILYDFIEALGIYPAHSTVLLSDHTTATIDEVSKYTPILPIVKRIDQDAPITLPLDFSLTVSGMIHSQSKSFQMRFKVFFNDLIRGDKQTCSDRFTDLVDGLQLEEIYTKIFLPSYRKTVKLLNENLITQIQYYVSHAILIELLEQLEREMKELNNYKFKMSLIIDKKSHNLVPLKIVLGLLHIENIFPIVTDFPLSENHFKKHVVENDIESICIVYSNERTMRKYQSMFDQQLNLVHISFHQIEQILNEITEIKSGRIDFFRQLFSYGEALITG